MTYRCPDCKREDFASLLDAATHHCPEAEARKRTADKEMIAFVLAVVAFGAGVLFAIVEGIKWLTR